MKSTEISVKISILPQLQLLQSLPVAMAPVRDNCVLTEAVIETMVDTKCDLETALAWTFSAKDSLQSFYGTVQPYSIGRWTRS